jgi:hypothetical protein
MYKKIKQNLLFIFLFFVSVTAFPQNTFEINLSITDTVIVAKKLIKKRGVKKSDLYAIKVNAELNVPMLQDSVVLHSFNEYVSSSFFLFNDFQSNIYKKTSTGLMYVIENKEGNIIPAYFAFVSYENPKVDIKRRNERIFLSPKLRIERRLLNEQEQQDYDLAKYVIHSKKQSLKLYPLLGKYHFNLPKGEYYLYFVYSDYNPRVLSPDMRVKGKLDEGNVFRDYFISNKVKLIVE